MRRHQYIPRADLLKFKIQNVQNRHKPKKPRKEMEQKYFSEAVLWLGLHGPSVTDIYFWMIYFYSKKEGQKAKEMSNGK